MSEWTPIGHRPPLRRIDDAPYTPAPPDPPVSKDMVPAHVRQQIAHMEEMMRKKEFERVWGHVVQTAKGG